MRRRILLVEDNPSIRRVLRIALRDEDLDVIEAATGEEGLELFEKEQVDVVLLDIMLPGIDGFEVCRSLRRVSDVPVIMVTARGDSHDVVAGLEAGADDYVSKPLVAKVLSARIRALLRRAKAAPRTDDRIEVGDLVISPQAGLVQRDGSLLDLTRTEFRLLCELAANLGAVVSREDLLERVWGYDYFGDGRLVDAHVHRLRTKIESDSGTPRFLVTVRGLGYRLQA